MEMAKPTDPFNRHNERRVRAAVDSPAWPLPMDNQGAAERSAAALHYYQKRPCTEPFVKRVVSSFQVCLGIVLWNKVNDKSKFERLPYA